VTLLRAHQVTGVADVRRFPASRRHPHFGREALEQTLSANSIAYSWHPELGGRRSKRPDSKNTGWRVAAFQGYADYMETPEFAKAIEDLLGLAALRRTAVMCAEALWWQCHRRLIADYLTARGHAVTHIEAPERASPHRLISPAHLVSGELSYAAEQEGLDLT
jgi:uncharacterized protein (DUF488 family)